MANFESPQYVVFPTLTLALYQAAAYHASGQLQEAERLYRAILAAQTNYPDASHNLGLLEAQTGQPTGGLQNLKAALEASPNHGPY